jgi:hypothetical protein
VRLLAYDLLEDAGQDLRGQPLHARRARLAALGIPASPLLAADDWAGLAALRAQARAHRVEGLMLKHRDSAYGLGRTGSGEAAWWKWKLAPLAVDALLIYAQAGHGRRANLYTDYSFAVWSRAPRDAAEAAAVLDGAADAPADLQLVPFAKAYSGLSDEEIRRVDRVVRQTTLEKFGPVRRLRPTLLFELGFEGIQPSARHKSGLAVRFPRMLRWREDKPCTRPTRWKRCGPDGRHERGGPRLRPRSRPGCRRAAGRPSASSARSGRRWPPAARACCTPAPARARRWPCGWARCRPCPAMPQPPARCRCCGSRPCGRSATTPCWPCRTPRALAPGWTLAARTGDTSSSERSAQQKRWPTGLVTTPESLSLLLARADAPTLLKQVRLVVVDEWHELLGSKRGVQLQLALARLRRWHPGLMTWGLSATLANLDEARDSLAPDAVQVQGATRC